MVIFNEIVNSAGVQCQHCLLSQKQCREQKWFRGVVDACACSVVVTDAITCKIEPRCGYCFFIVLFLFIFTYIVSKIFQGYFLGCSLHIKWVKHGHMELMVILNEYKNIGDSLIGFDSLVI